MNYRKYEQTNDQMIYEKLESGREPSWVEWIFLFDDNSIYNKMKQEHDNREFNEALEKCIEKKEEKEKALMIDLMERIYEYISWQQTEYAKAYAAAKIQENNMADDYRRDEDRLMKDSAPEKGWLENLIKNLNIFLIEDPYYHHFFKTSMNAAEEGKKDTITNVLHLATCNKTIRDFIFENPDNHDKIQHCHLIMERILFVGNLLKNEIPSNKVLQEHIRIHRENKKEAESDVPRTKLGSP